MFSVYPLSIPTHLSKLAAGLLLDTGRDVARSRPIACKYRTIVGAVLFTVQNHKYNCGMNNSIDIKKPVASVLFTIKIIKSNRKW